MNVTTCNILQYMLWVPNHLNHPPLFSPPSLFLIWYFRNFQTKWIFNCKSILHSSIWWNLRLCAYAYTYKSVWMNVYMCVTACAWQLIKKPSDINYTLPRSTSDMMTSQFFFLCIFSTYLCIKSDKLVVHL